MESDKSASNLIKLIAKGDIDSIQKLISEGLRPSERRLRTNLLKNYSTISPLCYALLKGKLNIARYFCNIAFFTNMDLVDRERVKRIREHLKNSHNRSLEFLDELCFQPLPLEKLCLLAVRFDMGEERLINSKVNELPIPNTLKEKVLFRITPARDAIDDITKLTYYNLQVGGVISDDDNSFFSDNDSADYIV